MVNAGPTAPSTPFTVSIDNERLTVTSVAANVWTVTRGVGGTTATTHAAGANVITVPISEDIRSLPTGIALQDAGPTETTVGQNGAPTVLLGTYMNQNENALTNTKQTEEAPGVNTTTANQSTNTPIPLPGTAGGTTTTDTITLNDPYQQIRQDFYDPIQVRLDVGVDPSITSSITLSVKLVSPNGTTINLGSVSFAETNNGIRTIIFADYLPAAAPSGSSTTSRPRPSWPLWSMKPRTAAGSCKSPTATPATAATALWSPYRTGR